VIFVGHSHMMCVLNAVMAEGRPFRAVSLKASHESRRAELGNVDWSCVIDDPGDPDFRDTTKALFAATETPIFSFISGTKHLEFSLRRVSDPAEPAFDFVLPESPDLPLDESALIVPTDAMREVMRHGYRSRFNVLATLTAAATTPVYQFAPPPLAPDALIAKLAAKVGDPNDRASRLVRWKLWRLTVDVFRETAERLGARFVDYPPDSVDADGFMRPELVRDSAHGNEAFGALVLDQIKRLP
jgi:hypothetical protein